MMKYLCFNLLVLFTILQHCLAEQPVVRKFSILDGQKTISKWLEKGCLKVHALLHRKKMAVAGLKKLVTRLSNKKDVKERKYHTDMFYILTKELDEAEQTAVQSFAWLDAVLRGDYKDLLSLKDSSLARLNALRDATLKEEQEYNEIVKAQSHVSHLNHTHISGLIDEILKQVSKAADQLEIDLNDHVFDNAVHHLAKGANIETVIRLDDAETSQVQKTDNRIVKNVLKLVDAEDNQFVLAKGKDSTVPHEDYHLIYDILLLMLSSFVACWICTLLSIPSMFGYIVGGVLLGPSGFNVLKSLVQIETLGEFGVFFILFMVGLEFSPAKLSKVLKTAVVGTLLMMCLTVLLGITVGILLSVSVSESGFVAACLSLSSTPLVIKFLNPYAKSNSHGPSGSEYGTVLMAILIMQDVLLGLIMAVLPTLAGSSSSTAQDEQRSAMLAYVVLTFKTATAIAFTIIVTWFISRNAIGRFFRHILVRSSTELTVLTTIMLMFVTLMLTDMLHISVELGCFLAGILISAQGQKLAEQIEQLVQPIKDFLSCFFFASIGLHVFPQFLAYELTILTTFTMAVVGTKYIICIAVLSVLMRKSSSQVKWVVAAGLAQVSEFSFVLGSRARRLSLISREVYLLILSVTTLSLIFAPVFWKVTLWYMHLSSSLHRPAIGSHLLDCKEEEEGNRETSSDNESTQDHSL